MPRAGRWTSLSVAELAARRGGEADVARVTLKMRSGSPAPATAMCETSASPRIHLAPGAQLPPTDTMNKIWDIEEMPSS